MAGSGKLTRRECLKGPLAATAGALAASSLPASVWSQVAGANGLVRLAVVGVQRRGPQLIEAFRQVPGVRIVAVCDADTAFTDRQKQAFEKRRQELRTYQDVRKLLEAKDVDAVAIATPNHWHALMCVWACQAGKDVYVEKPVSHGIWEGRRMVEAARKYGRIVATGTQNRSDVGLRAALEYLREGPLGRMLVARGFDYPQREPIGKVDGPQVPPATVDYNLFQGPAPLVPLRRERLHYDWHYVWATGDGDCGNRGVHTLDMIRWFLGQPALAPSVASVAGRFGWDDDGQTPNSQVTVLGYEPVPIVWELHTLPELRNDGGAGPAGGVRTSMVIEYEGGFFAGYRGGGRVHDAKGKVVRSFKGDGGRTHYANFIDAVRSRRPADLRADVLEGHVSSALCHQANVSYLVGRRTGPDETAGAIKDDALLAEATGRLFRHLSANGIDPKQVPITLGPKLAFDPKAERFTGEHSDWANMCLKASYRPPFIVPENV
ncbi:MAG TPA: Gfo/Idh/MocA family oxidoreductase [Phycisphaerae bacterium]|nr:Gfo/Idh/MocA family oxidoreductase [Phycisphaerae bacterium]